MAAYVPDRGDFVWIDLNPRQGREQSGHRPALVISPKAYNRKTSLCVICPATRQAKGYPFEVSVHTADGSTSVILADHVRSVDWKLRRVRRIEPVPDEVLNEVIGHLEALLINPDC
jgi:mRNA interferase MazF